MDKYWIDITIKGGWTKSFQVKANSLKHALEVAEKQLLNDCRIVATETYEQALDNSHKK